MRLSFSIKLLLLSVLVCVFFMPDRQSLFDSKINILLTTISLINVFVYFNTVKKFYQSWFRYDVLFIIGFLIVHFQIPYLEAIGISPSRPDFIWINKKVVNFATWFSTLFLLLWMLGFYLYLIPRKPTVKIKIDYAVKKHWIVDILLAGSFILFIILVGSDFLSGNHAGTYNWGTGATYVFLILRIVLTLSIIYFYINNKGKLNSTASILKIIFDNKLLFIISILYCFLFLYVGDRGPIMQVGITYMLGYALFQGKISLFRLIVLLLSGAVFFTIIRQGRAGDVSNRDGNVITSGYSNLKNDENPFNPTDELASSVRILYRALDVVPDRHPYLYGTTLISNIVDVVPMSSTFYQVPPMYSNSTTFFTVLGQGQYYSYGEGSEIIADLYINLGFWLTLMVIFLFGYFISYLTFNVHYKGNHNIYIIYFILVIGAVYINRSNFLNPLKMIIYAIILDKLVAKRIKIK